MQNSHYDSYFPTVNQFVDSHWDGEVLDRAAQALYRWRRPQQSWYNELYEIDDFSINWFYGWAEKFLKAAMPEGLDAEEWYVEDAARVYYEMAHEGCVYAGLAEQRWPSVGHWYERVATSVMNAALYDVPVDNSSVRPQCLKKQWGSTRQ